MRVAMVMPFFRADVSRPEVVLERYPLMRLLPGALVRMGHEITVLAHSPIAAHVDHGGVHHEFVRPSRVAITAGQKVHARKPRYGPAYYIPNLRLIRRLRQLRPDVVHFFGLTMDIHLALTLQAMRRDRVPVVVHFHGGLPGSSGKLRRLQSHNLNRVARVLFTTMEQARIWLDSGLGLRDDQISIVMESSSPFRGVDRQEARCRTGMTGDPLYLSVARLHPVKDILTTLRGYEIVHASQPDSRFYLCYQSTEMLEDVQGFLAARPGLSRSVELRGSVPAEEIEAVYSSADFLLQASLREWSGLAVMEAMSCGCIPIVSDIPSFSALTMNGCYGRLFATGDPEGLAAAALGIQPASRQTLSRDVRRHFRDRLSFDALALDIANVYVSVAGASG